MRLKYLVFSMAALLFESGCKQLFREPTLDFSYKVPEQIGDGWTVSTLAAEGLRQAPIDSMTRLIVTDKFKNMHSVVIIKNHKLVYENYFNGYDRGMVHNLYSASKSFTSALIGVAID
ncbi:MAG TPA: hypothetical protein VL947_12565, partial [Cytophagales bacterium]|nr:hypothetical protein [Cytophagales bacterium]